VAELIGIVMGLALLWYGSVVIGRINSTPPEPPCPHGFLAAHLCSLGCCPERLDELMVARERERQALRQKEAGRG